VKQLQRRIEGLMRELSPALLNLPGCAGLSAAKLVAETADISRFRSSAAFAMHNGTAPIPVWSGNQERHRLNRGGNRQLNVALHRIAIT
jgi:transposase